MTDNFSDLRHKIAKLNNQSDTSSIARGEAIAPPPPHWPADQNAE